MPKHEGEERGADGELESRGHALGQQIRDRLPELIGDAEIALRGAHEIARELHRDRIVEAERAAHLLALGSGRVEGDDLVHRIAGEAEHRKGDDADGQKNADGLEGASDDESEHAQSLDRFAADARMPRRDVRRIVPGSELPGTSDQARTIPSSEPSRAAPSCRRAGRA